MGIEYNANNDQQSNMGIQYNASMYIEFKKFKILPNDLPNNFTFFRKQTLLRWYQLQRVLN